MSSVYDRLTDPKGYTGVYAKRFEGDGRINHHTDQSMSNAPGSGFKGNTNTGTNETIHDISQMMRPNLRYAGAGQGGNTGMRHGKGANNAEDGGPGGAPGARRQRQRRFSAASGMWKDVNTGQAMNPAGTAVTATAHVEYAEAPEMDTSEQLKAIFQYYCTFGRTGGKGSTSTTLDNSNFAKFSRECPALLDKRLTRTEVDLIFTKAKPKFQRRLDFTHFLDALSAMASKKYPKYDPTTAFSIILSNHVFKLPCAPMNAHREALGGDPYAAASPGQQQQQQQQQQGGMGGGGGGGGGGGFLGAAAQQPGPSQADVHEDHYQQYQQQRQDAMRAAQAPAAPAAPAGYEYSHEDHYQQHQNEIASTQEQMRTTYLSEQPGGAQGMSPAMGGASPARSAGGGTPGSSNRGGRGSAPDNAPIAGEANREGGVYDRLSRPENFSGVYKKRFEGHGRINSDTQTTNFATGYKGSTNTGTDETFHDISGMMRTNLAQKGGRMMRF